MRAQTQTYKIASAALVLLIFALVPLARPIERFLEPAIDGVSQIPLAFWLHTALAGAVLAAAEYRWDRRRLQSYLAALALGGTAAWLANPKVEMTHIALYGGLMFLLCRSWFADLSPRSIINALAVCTAVSVSDEILQAIHPERFFDLRDLLLNLLSSGCGLCLSLPRGLALSGLSAHSSEAELVSKS